MTPKNIAATKFAILAILLIASGFLMNQYSNQLKEQDNQILNEGFPLTVSDIQKAKIQEEINVPYILHPKKLQSLLPINNVLCTSESLYEENFKLKVYSACNDLAKQEGLKIIQDMPSDQGMLFVYPNEQVLGFWMHQTYLPLSIAFLDKDFKVVKTAEMIPLDKTSVSSVKPAKYALELNKGKMEQLGIKEGSVLSFKPSDEKLNFIPEERHPNQDVEIQLFEQYHNK